MGFAPSGLGSVMKVGEQLGVWETARYEIYSDEDPLAGARHDFLPLLL